MNNLIQKLPNIVLAIISGLLLWAAWPPSPLFPLIFIAFVPLLILEKRIANDEKKKKGWRFFKLVFLAMFIWNLATTYWIWYATASVGAGPASAGSWILNSLFMTIPWVGYQRIKRRFSPRIAFLSLISFWLCFEFLHFIWELAWPWLTLGNVFAKFPALIQWYEITGASGGTLWILIVNIFFFLKVFNPNNQSKTRRKIALGFILIGLPMILSVVRFSTYKNIGQPINVSIIQPNLDPYTENKEYWQQEEISDRLANLSAKHVTTETDYIILPESSLPDYPWVSKMDLSPGIQRLKSLNQKAPNAKVVMGADVYENYGTVKETATARYAEQAGIYYDVYNAAIQFAVDDTTEVYAKSKLVPGVERMPYPQFFRFLEKLIINLGGATGSRGTQKEREVFSSGKANIAVPVCYESIFGDYLSKFVKNGADVIFIITNDGWWNDTPGYKQHFHYSKLRAIENRRSIARSANTGISAFIDQKGVVTDRTGWWVETGLQGSILTNSKLTFFTKHGDVLGRIAVLLTIIISLISLVNRFTKGFKYRV